MPFCWFSKSMKLCTHRAGQENRVQRAVFWCAPSCRIACTLWHTKTASRRSAMKRQTLSVRQQPLTTLIMVGTLTIDRSWCKAKLCSRMTQWQRSPHGQSKPIGAHMEIRDLPQQMCSATALKRTRVALRWLTVRIKPTVPSLIKRWKSKFSSRTVCHSKSSHRDRSQLSGPISRASTPANRTHCHAMLRHPRRTCPFSSYWTHSSCRLGYAILMLHFQFCAWSLCCTTSLWSWQHCRSRQERRICRITCWGVLIRTSWTRCSTRSVLTST